MTCLVTNATKLWLSRKDLLWIIILMLFNSLPFLDCPSLLIHNLSIRIFALILYLNWIQTVISNCQKIGSSTGPRQSQSRRCAKIHSSQNKACINYEHYDIINTISINASFRLIFNQIIFHWIKLNVFGTYQNISQSVIVLFLQCSIKYDMRVLRMVLNIYMFTVYIVNI